VSVEELARASCAIYVDGRREETGTLVTDSHVLTAAHVLRHRGSLTMRFRDGLLDEAIPVERLPLGADAEELDIAGPFSAMFSWIGHSLKVPCSRRQSFSRLLFHIQSLSVQTSGDQGSVVQLLEEQGSVEPSCVALGSSVQTLLPPT
jgi:hypothetical protein